MALLLLCGSLCGCGKAEPKDAAMRVTAIAGPTGMGLSGLMQSNADGKAEQAYDFTVVNDPAQAVAAITSKTADVAAISTNQAAALYQKTGGKIRVLAVNTLGVLEILENGDTVHSVADLAGKEITAFGQGTNTEYVLRFILEWAGLDPDKDVTLNFVEDADTLSTLVTNGTAKVALVPQPKATACLAGNQELRMALDLNDVWQEAGAGALMMGCVVARTEFIEKHPKKVETFMREYAASVEQVVSDPKTAGEWCATFGIVAKSGLAAKAIPQCHLVYMDGKEMKASLSQYLRILSGYDLAAVGGEMPDDEFYYEK